ncbi:MAG TPA: hypothetical protein VF210_09475 [Pseudomonadales bacterium]
MTLRALIGSFLPMALMIPLGGCVTATVQEIREADTGMEAHESIAVLGRRTLPSNAETEFGFVDCVSRNMRSGGNAIRVIHEDEFRDALFPWFEPRTAPVNTSDLPEIISQPMLAKRLEELGLRYLVWIEGDTDRTDSGGSLTCSVTTAGAGCFGFLTWENDSSYEASIWDIRTGQSVGKISSDAVGTSYMPAVIVPLPLIARVRSSACNSLADQLKVFLTAEN